MKWFLRLCVCGFVGTLLVWALPGRFKPYHIHRGWNDWKIMVEGKTWETGFGPSGVVHAHIAAAWQSHNPRLLEPMRSDWKAAKLRPALPMTIDSDHIMWDEWGPNVTVTPTGVGSFEVGAIYTCPYSIIAMLFAAPPVWWMARELCRRKMRAAVLSSTG